MEMVWVLCLMVVFWKSIKSVHAKPLDQIECKISVDGILMRSI